MFPSHDRGAGNATDFGDLSYANYNAASSSNAVRGIIVGGYAPSSATDQMDFLTIATTGNSQDFGDATAATATAKACSDSTHVFIGGGSGPNTKIQRVNISTLGDAVDWGTFTARDELCGSTSNGHGGLG